MITKYNFRSSVDVAGLRPVKVSALRHITVGNLLFVLKMVGNGDY